MPVVFDEIIGTVEPVAEASPEPAPGEGGPTARPAPPDPRALRDAVNRMAARQARLRAD